MSRARPEVRFQIRREGGSWRVTMLVRSRPIFGSSYSKWANAVIAVENYYKSGFFLGYPPDRTGPEHRWLWPKQ